MNFNIIVDTSVTGPANPIENTIWINSTYPVTSYLFTPSEPSHAAGLLWIRTAVDAPVVLDAVTTYNTSIRMYLYTPYVSYNGSWVGVVGKVWQQGSWAPMLDLPSPGMTLEQCTWNQINSVSAQGNPDSYFSIGDRKTILVGTESVELEIIGMQHDTLSSDHSSKAQITFAMVDCLRTLTRLNTSNANVGGFRASEFYPTLTTTIFNTLPADLRGVAKYVDKRSCTDYLGNSISTTSERIFLLSEIEVYGTTEYSRPGEGIRYARFAAGHSTIKLCNGSATSWWLRSPHTSGSPYNYSYYFSIAGSSSLRAFVSDPSLLRGVAFALCV